MAPASTPCTAALTPYRVQNLSGCLESRAVLWYNIASYFVGGVCNMLKKNDLISLEIQSVTSQGSGVGRHEGMAVFVQIGRAHV